MNPADTLYPLTFTPIYKEKVWGGRALEKLGRDLPGDETTRIGESWELADLATTSVSGGGGSSEHSVVAEGSLKGQTIRQLIERYGEALLGQGVAPSADGGFPLLIKFLDARENLSVQVHPSPEYAAAHPGAHLKCEAWYVVDAVPGAVIYKGLKPGTTAAQLRAALKINTDQAVVPLLNAIPVRQGDCHYLPSGTLHALGAGVLVAEVQTPSDTTFRVYDWGRTDRELHIEQAMACIDFSERGNKIKDKQGNCNNIELIRGLPFVGLAECEHFTMLRYGCTSDIKVEFEAIDLLERDSMLSILIGLCGSARLTYRNGTEAVLGPGKTVLQPACFEEQMIEAETGTAWLSVSFH